MNQETIDFIAHHSGEDVRRLAFLAPKHPQVDMPFALNQIDGRRIAARKLPSWAAVDGVIYPPHLSLEQCSGERAALYKRALVERLLPVGARNRLADLTGGFGVDFITMAPLFRKAVMVELKEDLCEAVRHNAKLLGAGHAEVVCGDGTAALESLEQADLIYIDPARRDKQGGRTYGIADCVPDVAQLREAMLAKAGVVMIKLSPMLDWHEAVKEMRSVAEVHIVSVDNECKELLLVMRSDAPEVPVVHCVNNDSSFVYSPSGLRPVLLQRPLEGGCCLYEPNSSLMKAGCFGDICARYGVEMVAPNSHLFVSETPVEAFPGRGFTVTAVSSMAKQALRKALQGMEQANITVRNFPVQADILRRKLRIKDGGDTYIMATTMADNTRSLIICKKIM